MTKISPAFPKTCAVLVLVLILLPALLSGGRAEASPGGRETVSLSSGAADDAPAAGRFAVGRSTRDEIRAELGEPDNSTFLFLPETTDYLESAYLDEGEEIDDVVDLSRFAHSQDYYLEATVTPKRGPVRITGTFYIYSPEGLLVGTDTIRADGKSEDELMEAIRGVLYKYLDLYEKQDAAAVEAELIRIKGPRQRSAGK